MKKIISIFLVCITIANFAQAQESKAIPEKIYTPQAGDLGLSVDILAPMMNYFGNMFNANTNNTAPTTFSGPDFSGSGNVSISGRYFIYDDLALRAAVSLNNNKTTLSNYVQDDAAFAADPLSVAQVTDASATSNNDMYISLGAEIRRGYNRLQGFYGVQLIGGFESQKTTYSYGNAITSINNMPSQSFATTPNNNVGGNSRLLETNTTGGKNLLIGIGGFVGVEYFIMPKIAIGGEINLTAAFVFGSQEFEKSERYNFSSEKVEENIRLSNPGTDQSILNTHNFGNSIYVAFYF